MKKREHLRAGLTIEPGGQCIDGQPAIALGICQGVPGARHPARIVEEIESVGDTGLMTENVGGHRRARMLRAELFRIDSRTAELNRNYGRACDQRTTDSRAAIQQNHCKLVCLRAISGTISARSISKFGSTMKRKRDRLYSNELTKV